MTSHLISPYVHPHWNINIATTFNIYDIVQLYLPAESIIMWTTILIKTVISWKNIIEFEYENP